MTPKIPSVPSGRRIRSSRTTIQGFSYTWRVLSCSTRATLACRVRRALGSGRAGGTDSVSAVRLVIARCSVDYVGRLTAHLPMAPRLLLVKSDGSVSVHADDRAYKQLKWMSPPCSTRETYTDDASGGAGQWTVTNKAGEQLLITIEEILHDSRHDLGVD